MKKILGSLIICLVLMFLVGCNDNTIPKTEYSLGEKANIDKLNVTLKEVNMLENSVLEAIFTIENNRNNTITIEPDIYFRLYDINKVQIPNHYEGNNNIIKSNNKINYTLKYDVTEKSIYEIYFYSGIVENNIKFTITNLDL